MDLVGHGQYLLYFLLGHQDGLGTLQGQVQVEGGIDILQKGKCGK